VAEHLCSVLGNPERDIMIVKGPVDALDHASPYPAYGSKMCIDATRKWREEGYLRELPEEAVMSEEIKAKVEKVWKKIEEQMRRLK
ncbi:MAG TPA: menaquinone biosynthesis decarboxylase, partial [Thermodesulfobacterium commune]|nr:menaquinone biosynthesis decarboxylase [Thermodesulfobacterium commune]